MAWLDEDAAAAADRRRPARSRASESGFRARLDEAVANLRARDKVLTALIEKHGPCALQPASSVFPVVIETVISQQLSTLAARAIYRRLIGLVGRRAPRPVDILKAPDEQLVAIGLSRSKVRYVKNAAEAFRSRRLGPKSFDTMTDEDVVALLTSIKGIGEWSAHMFLIFALGRLDVFPIGDLGLRNAMASAYGLRRPPSPASLGRVADRWRPYRTVGTWYLWESYDNR